MGYSEREQYQMKKEKRKWVEDMYDVEEET